MRICIYGAGAMGTVFGALLTEAGVPCDLISRNAAHIAVLRERGAFLYGCIEKNAVRVRALEPQEMTGKYDLIFLATKQRENRAAAEYLTEFIEPDGALVSIQNGLPEAGLAAVFGNDRVYGAALSWGAETEYPGRVRVTSDSGFRVALGAFGNGTRLQEIGDILKRAFLVEIGNLAEIRYAKLAVNAAFSTLSAISGLTFGTLSVKYKKIVLALLRETLSVAAADGCTHLPLNGHDLFKVFGGPFARVILPVAMKKYSATRSGMLKDIRAGRRCDVDCVAGAVVNAAERLGIAAPFTSRAVELVHEIENGFAELSPETLTFLYDCRKTEKF